MNRIFRSVYHRYADPFQLIGERTLTNVKRKWQRTKVITLRFATARTPSYLPDSWAQSISDGILELKLEKQFSKLPRASNPTVSKLAFTPHMRAVAHAEDSPIWASMLYVCKKRLGRFIY